MKIMIRRSPETGLSIYVPKKDLEEPIVESEHESLWGGWIRIANGWVLELPEMAAGTSLPITVNARKRGEAEESAIMNVAVPDINQLRLGDADAAYPQLVRSLREGTLVPYLGPGLAELAGAEVPTSAEALAAFFGTKVALPRRAKGNVWAAAQHIESNKHRSTVTALMAQAFEPAVAPTALHRFLASLPLPMIVDAWYDGAMRAALAERSDWGEIQGNTRAGIGEDRWYRFYDSKGAEADREVAKAWTTLLYKPHGGIAPARNFLISDADYVEVLTEIDIQTPIPDEVRHRRTDRSFLFLGCRFNDQLLRTYARQITKRSSARHYVVVEPDALSRNELRFFASYGLTPIVAPLAEVAEALLAVA